MIQKTQLADTATAMVTDDEKTSHEKKSTDNAQLALFDLPDPIDPETKQVVDELKNINVATMTPLEALMKLNEWQQTVQ